MPDMAPNKSPWEKTDHLWDEMLEESLQQDQMRQGQKLRDQRHGRENKMVWPPHADVTQSTSTPSLQHQMLWKAS